MSRPSGAPTSRIFAFILIIAGAALAIVAVLADAIGLSGGGEGFGWKQLIAAIAGLVVALCGVAWLLHSPAPVEPDDVSE
ncbi:MAG TPA: hypothetical protein VFL82_13290 [Thermomicrobiales bacterium]|jgi:hypothetical protein|nr:hypothetical protein [Thermomicrobiales bacterium]